MDLSDAANPSPGFTTPTQFDARSISRDEQRLRSVKQQWERAMKDGYELRGVPLEIDGSVMSSWCM